MNRCLPFIFLLAGLLTGCADDPQAAQENRSFQEYQATPRAGGGSSYEGPGGAAAELALSGAQALADPGAFAKPTPPKDDPPDPAR